VITSMLLERADRRLTLKFSGGIPPLVLRFATPKEACDHYDELVAIEENEKNVDPS
jgi:hypothetical protein